MGAVIRIRLEGNTISADCEEHPEWRRAAEPPALVDAVLVAVLGHLKRDHGVGSSEQGVERG
jgi:hypothetical protein